MQHIRQTMIAIDVLIVHMMVPSCVWLPVYVQAVMQQNPSRSVDSCQITNALHASWHTNRLSSTWYANSLGLLLVRQRLGLAVGTPTISMSLWFSKLCWACWYPRGFMLMCRIFCTPTSYQTSYQSPNQTATKPPTSSWSTKP